MTHHPMINLYRFEQRIEAHVARGDLVGLAIALVHGEEVSYARGFGLTSVEDAGIPVTPRTLFCIGSISKSITATLVMRLVDAGVLDVDRPVVEYLPGFAFSDPDLGRRITLRHVLSHSSGLPSAGKDFGPRDPGALGRFVREEIPRYGFVAPPGTLYLYSNTVPVIAAHVAEVATGQYYDRLVAEWVFGPLGMTRATFDRTVAMTYPVALAHDRGADGAFHTRHRFTDNVSGNPAGFGLASTLDLARFAAMHLNGGRHEGTLFLSPESIAEQHRAHIRTFVPGSDEGYGLGLYSGEFAGHRQVSHGGMLESYWCNLSVFPDAGVALVLQCNAGDDAVLGSLLHDLTHALLGTDQIERLASQPPKASHTDRREQLEGTYLSLRFGLAHIATDGGAPVLARFGDRVPLRPDETGQFRSDHGPVAFLDNGESPPEYLIVDAEPYRRITLDPAFVPTPSAWSAFPGVYEEIPDDPYPIAIRVTDGTLYREQEGDSHPCIPLSDTRFVSDAGVIDFVRDADGATVLVTGEASWQFKRPA